VMPGTSVFLGLLADVGLGESSKCQSRALRHAMVVRLIVFGEVVG
jgi:hypothetical protein